MDLSLRADCRRCAALCCVALVFDRGPAFALDKAAGEPCPHLGRGGCRIHASRAARGFGGCVGYDCLGAGQRVTQALFQGRNWRDEPALLGPMTEAFRVVQRAHAMLELLGQARRLPLSPAERARAAALEAALEAAGASAEAVTMLAAETRVFVRTLRGYVRRGERAYGQGSR